MNVGDVVEFDGKKYKAVLCDMYKAFLCSGCAFNGETCLNEDAGEHCFNEKEELYFVEV